MKLLLSTSLLLLSLCAQADNLREERKGKPIIKIFTNLHSGFGAARHDRGFELDRSYLGYEYKLTDGLTITGLLDVGKSQQVDDYQRIAYLKNMMLQWQHKQLTLKAGLIPTTQFGWQEKFWNLRYLHKSFQDEYKFGNSADLGLSVDYKLNRWLSADVLIANGEGYKKVQLNDGLLYSAGLSLTPIHRLKIRLFGAYNNNSGTLKKDLYNFASFIGYGDSVFSIGAEYNLKKEKNKSSFPQGFSVCSTIKLNKYLSIFGRYDQLFSPTASDDFSDEKCALCGMQYRVNSYIKLAPAFTYRKISHENKDEYLVGLYCYFSI